MWHLPDEANKVLELYRLDMPFERTDSKSRIRLPRLAKAVLGASLYKAPCSRRVYRDTVLYYNSIT